MPPMGALPMATMSMVPSWAPSRCAPSPLASELLMWSSILIRPLVFSWSALSGMPMVSLRGLEGPTAVPALRMMGAWAKAGPVKTRAIRDDRTTARHRCMTRSPRAVLEAIGAACSPVSRLLALVTWRAHAGQGVAVRAEGRSPEARAELIWANLLRLASFPVARDAHGLRAAVGGF